MALLTVLLFDSPIAIELLLIDSNDALSRISVRMRIGSCLSTAHFSDFESDESFVLLSFLASRQLVLLLDIFSVVDCDLTMNVL